MDSILEQYLISSHLVLRRLSMSHAILLLLYEISLSWPHPNPLLKERESRHHPPSLKEKGLGDEVIIKSLISPRWICSHIRIISRQWWDWRRYNIDYPLPWLLSEIYKILFVIELLINSKINSWPTSPSTTEHIRPDLHILSRVFVLHGRQFRLALSWMNSLCISEKNEQNLSSSVCRIILTGQCRNMGSE